MTDPLGTLEIFPEQKQSPYIEPSRWDGSDWRTVHPLKLSNAQFVRWLALQRADADGGRRSIGGTAAAAILGVSNWKSAAEIWDFILRLAPDTYGKGKGYSTRGIVLEPHIAALYESKTQRKLILPDRSRPYVHPMYDFLTANPDFFIALPQGDIVRNGEGVLEIKTIYADVMSQVKDHGASDENAVQLQHYLNVCNKSWGAFAYFNADNWELYEFDIERDDKFCKEMQARLVEFWNYNIITRQRPPEIITGPAPIVVPRTGGEATVVDSDEYRQAVNAYANAKAEHKLSEHAVELARKRLEEMMTRDGHTRIIVDGHKLQWESAKGRSFVDMAALVREYPFIDLDSFRRDGEPTRPFNFWPARGKKK